MNTPAKLGGYAVGLAAVFGVAAGLGAIAGPVGTEPEASEHAPEDGGSHGADDAAHGAADITDNASGDMIPGGLMVSHDGYTLALSQPSLPAGDDVELSFKVIGPDGETVTDYDEAHEKDLHLIAVRRDLAGFQHVHPVLDADGTWSVPLDLVAGEWRILTDFTVSGGPAMVLGADLSVAGTFEPAALPEPSTSYEVDGYTVTLDAQLVPGEQARLTATVSKDGRPVTDLQPYLGAYGHLVALRDGDLAYLHVHPDGEPGDGVTDPGPDITFYATTPSVGDYRLFLDFQHEGVVRTAEFTVRADGTVAVPAPEQTTPEGGTEHRHLPTGDDPHSDEPHGH